MKEQEMDILYKYINSEKSIFSTMVLRLMDTSKSYQDALLLVYSMFPEINIIDLKNELDKYV
jgi:hypothetical protein